MCMSYLCRHLTVVSFCLISTYCYIIPLNIFPPSPQLCFLDDQIASLYDTHTRVAASSNCCFYTYTLSYSLWWRSSITSGCSIINSVRSALPTYPSVGVCMYVLCSADVGRTPEFPRSTDVRFCEHHTPFIHTDLHLSSLLCTPPLLQFTVDTSLCRLPLNFNSCFNLFLLFMLPVIFASFLSLLSPLSSSLLLLSSSLLLSLLPLFVVAAAFCCYFCPWLPSTDDSLTLFTSRNV